MGMQVFFDLMDVLAVGVDVTITMVRGDEGRDFEFVGCVTYGTRNPRFTISKLPQELPRPSVGNDCYADIAHDQTMVDFLIKNRVPFRAS